jgi:hypothetical protein
VGSEVNQLLNATTQLTTSMQDTALQNKQAQDQKDRDQALKRQQTSLLATLPPPASINTTAQAPTLPTAPSLPFTSGNAVMPASPAPAMPAPENVSTVDDIKNLVSDAFKWLKQLPGSGVQGVGQFVTAIPSQVGQFATNTVKRVGQFITGDKSTAVAQAAKSLEGSSSREGPGGGNVACAWKTAKALRAAGYDIKPGSPEEVNVNAQIAFLKKRGAVQVPQSEARPGDIVYSYDRHIGIVSEGQGSQARVISNSSSKAQFSWKSNLNFDGYYGQGSQIWRLPTTA